MTTQAELIDSIADQTGLPKVAVKNVLGAFVSSVHSHLRRRESIGLPELGKFEAVHCKARTGRNPATGDTIDIPERYAAKFRPAAALKAAVPPAKKGGKK